MRSWPLSTPAIPLPPPPCSEAEASLRGEEGRGALVATLRELVARRCLMVCQLGAIFQLGPTPGAWGWGVRVRAQLAASVTAGTSE